MKSIYVISTNAGAVKIGVSSRPEKRLAVAMPGSQPKVFWTSAPRQDAIAIEREIHRRLLDRRDYCEWFTVPPEEAVAIAQEVIAGADAGEKFEPLRMPLHTLADSRNQWSDDVGADQGNASWVGEVLADVCKKAGGQHLWAYHNRISRQHVNEVICGRSPPGPRLLAILGIERIVEREYTYRPISSPPSASSA